MPSYKYKREDGTTFTVQQSIESDPLEECPKTGQNVERVISGGVGTIYKTDGFHDTDYDNDGPKDDA